MELLLATTNRGKIREISSMLKDTGISIVGLPTDAGLPEPEETGSTFAENAAIKASYYALHFGMAALADDSGLEVSALNGEPGVMSARYGGEASPFDVKMKLILDKLIGYSGTEREARFVCSAALADAGGNIVSSATGICSGVIAGAPAGNGGFGYDPIFIPDGYDQTFGELPSEVKDSLSHRYKAISEILPFLREFFDV
jgi:XTP/dITP diphosphohydrolase